MDASSLEIGKKERKKEKKSDERKSKRGVKGSFTPKNASQEVERASECASKSVRPSVYIFSPLGKE